jgi:hypothetical protein
MKRFVMSLALTCALAGAASAGEVPSVGFTAPPPDEPPPPVTAPGEVPSGGLTQQMSEAALTLVQLMLGSIV